MTYVKLVSYLFPITGEGYKAVPCWEMGKQELRPGPGRLQSLLSFTRQPSENQLVLFCLWVRGEVGEGCLTTHPSSQRSPKPGGEPGLRYGCQGTGLRLLGSALVRTCALLDGSCWEISPKYSCSLERTNIFCLTLFWDEVAGPVET
jgi:hypothetical protein